MCFIDGRLVYGCRESYFFLFESKKNVYGIDRPLRVMRFPMIDSGIDVNSYFHFDRWNE